MKTTKSKRPARCPLPTCSPSFIAQAKKFCEDIAMLSDGEIVCKLADILAARSAAVAALRHCRLFIVERKGYTDNEEVERETLKRTIDSILSENAKVSHGDRERQPDTHSTHNQP